VLLNAPGVQHLGRTHNGKLTALRTPIEFSARARKTARGGACAPQPAGWLRSSLIALFVAIAWLSATADIAGEARLAELHRILPASAPWEAWLQRTGELPPDFAAMPGVGELPDALRFQDGRPVKSRKDWPARRAELLGLFQHYVIGRVPEAPGNTRVAESRERVEDGVRVCELTLEFGPEHRARLRVELLIPPGPGPFPVFITQDNHRRWALVAVSRGYLGCVYAGADSRDDTGAWTTLWPDFDWTKLTRRAWAASRCVDHLLTLPEVDPKRLALTGHSRNGKTALIGAALDERISAVISSSSGAGGPCTWRLFSETQFGEGIELITRSFPDWLHPRLRFFVGREDRLPVDQHELIACIAPRPVLLATALNDNVESVWAIEQTRRAALPVFALLGGADRLSLRYRAGGHPTDAGDIEDYLDWLDFQFGRSRRPVGDAPIYPTYEDWQRGSRERIKPRDYPRRGLDGLLRAADGSTIANAAQWPAQRGELRRRLEWLLGDGPPVAAEPGGSYGAESRPVATLLGRADAPSRLVKESLSFGNYVPGDLYFPTNVVGTDRRLPVFVWLHPLSVSHGYVAGYHRGEAPHLALTRSGYAVFAFDQIGNGSRIEEARRFYDRYPRWSLLGKTVSDARAAITVLTRHPRVDPEQIYLVGYGTGAMAALATGALDERAAGVMAIGGLTPLRMDTADGGTGGIARWSRWLPLLPRLGPFIGEERRIPADWHEVMALVAPRPLLVITPGIDHQSRFEYLQLAVQEARGVYELLGAPQGLVFQRTTDYHHFAPELIWCLCGVETIR
jgi:dienelactone hydrolase